MARPEALRDPLYDEVRAAEQRDPSVREVLEVIAGRKRPVTPTSHQVARVVNAERGAELREAFTADALSSREVAELLDVADHRAVAGRRSRGTLLGWTIGNETYHPAWQFADVGTVPGLTAVVKALGEVTGSVLVADRIMRREREDLDGRSLADLLADGQHELVVRLIRAVDA